MKNIAFGNLHGELRHDHNLARHTSWRVGGNAACCYKPANLVDLQHFLTQIPQTEPLTWLGLGSNVLVRDGGVPGVVILTLKALNQIDVLDETTIRAEAGVTCAKLAKHCVRLGFENGTFFAGIPGTVGGALAMNAGAFGGETWKMVTAVETIDSHGQLHTRMPHDYIVQYRQVDSRYQEYFVAGHFQFQRGDPARAKTNISRLLKRRSETQPIGQYSCGSVFRNPPGDHAARLIESAGLKGLRMGDAEVSSKHTNFIINRGHATARDIEKLMHDIITEIDKSYGISLVPEVHIIGVSE